MQQPPPNATRVSPDKLRTFIHEAARKVDMPDAQAGLLARLLVENDLRGVSSHGSKQLRRYVREIQTGGINPKPDVKIVRETDNSVMLDGDFGLGYFPAHEGTLKTIEKAKKTGMAAMVTRHHGHIGAAGIYARMTLEHDLLTFVTSGVQLNLEPGKHVSEVAGGSPMSFSAPTLNEPPLVLDCGVTHDIQFNAPPRDNLAQIAPGIVLRAIGFGTICQAWGGLLAGVPIDPKRAPQKYLAANQGAMLFAFKISLFADVEQFKREMDEYVQRTRTLTPLVNTTGAYLPGGIEAEQEQHYRREGIPLGEAHQKDLEHVAEKLQLQIPWKD